MMRPGGKSMRALAIIILGVSVMAMLLTSCALGPDVGDADYFRRISAEEIGGGIDPASIRIRDRSALLFTNRWTAVTPNGVYACTQDMGDGNSCRLKRR